MSSDDITFDHCTVMSSNITYGHTCIYTYMSLVVQCVYRNMIQIYT